MASELFASVSRDHVLRRERFRDLVADPEKNMPQLLEGDVIMVREAQPPFSWRTGMVVGRADSNDAILVRLVPAQSNAQEPVVTVLPGRIRKPEKTDIVQLSESQKAWLRTQIAPYLAIYSMT